MFTQLYVQGQDCVHARAVLFSTQDTQYGAELYKNNIFNKH